MSTQLVSQANAALFVDEFDDNSIALLLTDPPYFQITNDEWDNAWDSASDYAHWLGNIFSLYYRKLTPDGSLVFFSGIGKHRVHPLFTVIHLLEGQYTFRNWVTWKKRRGYGKSHDYIFCREEILWFSKSPERTGVRFNIPLTNERRGYKGWSEKYPAKSEFKRVSNVFADIPELQRPKRSCEKPVPLMRRLVETHSHHDDLVVDCFAGRGATALACIETCRRFAGCDTDPAAVEAANDGIEALTAAASAPRQEVLL